MSKNLKLAVCGDSWFSSDPKFPGTSFGEIICKKYNWKLLSLARCGASNFTICLQIDKAIELQSDIVIIGTTSVDRIEVPIKHHYKKSLLQRLHEDSQTPWVEGNYKKQEGLSNILYELHNDLSTKNTFIDHSKAKFMSDVFINFLNPNDSPYSRKHLLDKEIVDTLKSYLINIYDPEYKRQIDSWIISDACRRLKDANIPFLIFSECMHDGYTARPYQQEFLQDLKWMSPKNLITADEFAYHKNLKVTNNACYHYDENTGGEEITKFIEKKLSDLDIL